MSTQVRERVRVRPPVGAASAFTALVLWILFGQRFVLSFDTAGRGIVSPLEPVVIASTVFVWLLLQAKHRRIIPVGLGLRTIGPLYILLAVSPFLGVLIYGYGIHTLYAITLPLTTAAVFVLIRALPSARLWANAAFLLIAIHGLYGLAQLFSRLQVLPSQISDRIVRWDASSQLSFGDQNLVSLRSTGLFVNANTFGQWSVVAVVVSAGLLRGPSRIAGVALGVIGVLGSQSRTAAAALIAVMLIAVILAARRGAIGRLQIAVLAMVSVTGAASLFGGIQKLVEANAVDRFASGFAAITRSGEDENLAGRLQTWESALDFYWQQPIGTFGPPQLASGLSLDSQYVSFLLQGGVPLLLAFVLFLASPLAAGSKVGSGAPILWMLACAIGVMSLTSPALEEAEAMGLVWVAVGLTFLQVPQRLSPDDEALTGQEIR